MRHARSDYDPIQDPRPNGIPEDEPVFLIRAKDENGPATLRFWAERARMEGASVEITDAVIHQSYLMEDWQHYHGSKIPDAPEGTLRR